jgi:radical SAM protein with 4Fe4S-binding SPASM domain
MEKYYLNKYNELHYSDEEDKYILFNSCRCDWIVLDEIGKDIYSSLEHYGNVKAACNFLMKQYEAKFDEIYTDVVGFLNEIINRKFASEEYDEDLNESFSDNNIVGYPYNTMMISVTSHCNLNCIYCYNKDFRNSTEKTSLSVDESRMIQFLTQFKKDGGTGVVITGGEPFLYNNLWHICKCVKESGLKCKIISNTTIINSVPNLESVLMYVDDLALSLDSFDKKELLELWNVKDIKLESIEKGLQRIDRFSAEKRRLFVTISPIVTKKNLKSLGNVIRKTRDLLKNCDIRIEPTRYMQIGKICDGSLSISEDEYINTYVEACQGMGVDEKKIYINALTHNGKYRSYPVKNKFLCKPSFFLKENGDVFPCHSLTDQKYYLGNINKHDYSEISQKFISHMDKLSLVDGSECKECSFKYVCPYKGGICRDKEENCKNRLLKVMCASVV